MKSSVVCHDSEPVAYLATYQRCRRDMMLFSGTHDPVTWSSFCNYIVSLERSCLVIRYEGRQLRLPIRLNSAWHGQSSCEILSTSCGS